MTMFIEINLGKENPGHWGIVSKKIIVEFSTKGLASPLRLVGKKYRWTHADHPPPFSGKFHIFLKIPCVR